MSCPLCLSLENNIEFFYKFKNKDYQRCKVCDLIFLTYEFHVTESDELEIYDRHENSPEDLRYRKFLSRIFDPFKKKLSPNSSGLDFGCGMGPTLSVMFEEVGHKVKLFDKFFYNDQKQFDFEYDFITATEVFEHLRHPLMEIDRLYSCLKPGGYLGVMTKLSNGLEHFKTWHYKNDPTHIIFFSKKTFYWLAEKYKMEIEFFEQGVMILKKRL